MPSVLGSRDIEVWLCTEECPPPSVYMASAGGSGVITLAVGDVPQSVHRVSVGMPANELREGYRLVARNTEYLYMKWRAFYGGEHGARPKHDPKLVTDDAIDGDALIAQSRQRTLEKSGLVAVTAAYEPTGHRLVLELSNAEVVEMAIQAIPSLRQASSSELAFVELDGIGASLRWSMLDADVSVTGILRTFRASVNSLLRVP